MDQLPHMVQSGNAYKEGLECPKTAEKRDRERKTKRLDREIKRELLMM